MASPIFLVQQVLSALTNGEDDSTTAACISNSTNVPSKSGSFPLKGALDLPSLLFMFLSSSALRDWLKLIVIGGVFEYCRRLAFYCYGKLYSRFFITAYFEQGDTTYDWIMIWLSKQPSWNQTREVQISTRTFGLDETEDDNEGDNQKLTFLPALSSTYSLWHKGRWMRITRTRAENQSVFYSSPRETLELRILSWNYSILTEILQEAKTLYKASKENVVSIYVATIQNEWRFVASRPKRNIDSIVLDPGIKELLLDDAKDFMDSKPWYSARGIPFRRGYLLYGAPGSGKTSIIHSIAGELNLDVYILSLSRVGLDDTSLSELISELPEKCIALMEDIDAAFSQTLNRDAVPESPATPDSRKPKDPNATGASTSRISLSGLLNALDGVAAQEGRLLFATTNKYSALDSALTRPGRMDLHIEFQLASKFQAAQLYRCFFLPAKSEEKLKLSVLDSLDSSSEKSTSASSSGNTTPLTTDAPTPTCKGVSHRLRAPKLTQEEIDDLATHFSEALPEREFSMASLQGYLMMYKVRPHDAAKNFLEWIEKEQRDRAVKAS